MRFRGNIPCELSQPAGFTSRGEALFSAPIRTRCSIVKLDVGTDKTTVRADSSATRGSAREMLADAKVLLEVSAKPQIEARLVLIDFGVDAVYRIVGIFPRHDLLGKLDHYEVTVDLLEAPS